MRHGKERNISQQRFASRIKTLKAWLNHVLPAPLDGIEQLEGDASVRRYYRVHCENSSYVVMDFPQNHNHQPFVAIAKSFQQQGLYVPDIHAENTNDGFLLLSDFGDQLYLNALSTKTADKLYKSAFKNIILIQACDSITDYQLPRFDTTLYQQEISLFTDWYLKKLCRKSLTSSEAKQFEKVSDLLIQDALKQPQVCVHRDFHSRNLMVVGNKQTGILDFQDAVWGPITYDLISLLRDCYIDWPHQQVENWVLHFHQMALRNNLLKNNDPQQFLRWFDWMGLQRHLKCLGIFARLHLRDQKNTYLQYIPRINRYANFVCQRYPEFAPISHLFKTQ